MRSYRELVWRDLGGFGAPPQKMIRYGGTEMDRPESTPPIEGTISSSTTVDAAIDTMPTSYEGLMIPGAHVEGEFAEKTSGGIVFHRGRSLLVDCCFFYEK